MKMPGSKIQIPDKLQISMTQISNEKPYDLEERTFQFAKDTALYCRTLPKAVSHIEYSKQVIRSSGSTGANYIEANEALGKKDFQMKIKTSRKEAKESVYWLRLIVETNDTQFESQGRALMNEGVELKKIFSSILEK